MQEITGDMKMAEVLQRWPETANVFRTKGCHEMPGAITTRIMTVRSVARMEGVDLTPLLEELNKAATHARPREA